MKKKALGRGLEALIPQSDRADISPSEIDIDRISPNPDQPRFQIDERSLEELAASIRENGVLQPVLVRPHGSGYQLIAGERRLAAAQRAGLLKVPAVVREVPDDKLLELALIENIQREQLNPIEEAQAYQHLVQQLSTTQEELAARLGKQRSTVANSLRLLKLPPAAKQLVAEGKLSPGHARALLASDLGPADMSKAAALMVDRDWSVRDAERWAQRQKKEPRTDAVRDPNEIMAEDRLRAFLGTKVEIHTGRKGAGEIRIRFFSQDDLIRIYGLLTDKHKSNGVNP
ncbi:MAG TPA: ParB/RepB/Spo0J family partition protein [Acidobacteriota bacterium]|nr:ParB/RepB/Spo0J family partition protein [Acidobacteriota bacterium]